MSVINKMLRDLDLRQGGHAGDSTVSTIHPELRHHADRTALGTWLTVRPAQGRYRWWLVVAGLLAAIGAGMWVWWHTSTSVPRSGNVTAISGAAAATASATVLPVSAVASAAPAASAASVPSPSASATGVPAMSPSSAAGTVADENAPPAVIANEAATQMNLRMESSLSARKALDALLSMPPPAPLAAAASRPVFATPSPARTPVSAASTAATAFAPPSTPTVDRPKNHTATAAAHGDSASAPTLERLQQAGGDAVAQAQNLWNTGSHDAALDLMQQSIAAAERSAKSGNSPASNALLLALVREMTRMQLAEARFEAVWELLTRLEPLLGNQADLWAIRANAAQRLGRHEDSVHGYLMALQSRPDEQRWLLGAAVSLAALGNTASAAEMAEKARATGPVSKDILAYLRKTGVPLQE